ncbi:hypothetical protein D3C78_1822200 [compost metagenome]
MGAGWSAAAPWASLRAHQADSSSRKGASIITRTILAITAMSAAWGEMASPAATTCATSCTVEPTYRPYCECVRSSRAWAAFQWNSAG